MVRSYKTIEPIDPPMQNTITNKHNITFQLHYYANIIMHTQI